MLMFDLRWDLQVLYAIFSVVTFRAFGDYQPGLTIVSIKHRKNAALAGAFSFLRNTGGSYCKSLQSLG
jgi:hypothetical protein